MPHIVKKTYLFYYLALCLSAPLIFVFSGFEPSPLYKNYQANKASTVTTTLISSATGDTFCSGDAITFTALPDDADVYRFYINGILKQGPSSSNSFLADETLFDQDKVTVTLEKKFNIGTASLTITENKIDDAGKVYFKDQSVALDELTVCYGFNSVNLESSRSASVNGTLLASNDTRYQWMSSSDNNDWSAIIGANLKSYNPSELTNTTFFRRDVVNDLNETICRSQSNVLKVEVEGELKGGSISPVVQTLCDGQVAEELQIENGVTGRTVTYQWQKSQDNIIFTDVTSNGKSMSYQPGTITQSTYYRRATNAVGGSCIPQYSTVHKIDIIDLDAGEFDSALSQTVCYNISPGEFSTSPLSTSNPGREASSSNAHLSFQWEKSNDNGGSWQSIVGATEQNYFPPSLQESTWFRRKVTAELNGLSCEKITENIIKIEVISEVNKGTIHNDQDICLGEVPSLLELRNLTPTPGTAYAFQWEKSVESFPFQEMTGQISTGLIFEEDDPWIPQETTRYRVKITDITNPQCDPIYSDVVTITVRPLQKILQVEGPVDHQTICAGADINPVVLKFDGSATGIDLSDATRKGLSVTSNLAEKKYTITGNVPVTTNINIISTGSYCNPALLEYKIDVKDAVNNTVPDLIYANGFNTHQPGVQIGRYQICEGTQKTQFSADFIDPEKHEYTEFQWEIVSPDNAGSIDPKSGLMTWNTDPPAFDGNATFRVRSNGCDDFSGWRYFDVNVIPNQFPPDVVNKITNPIKTRIIADVQGFLTEDVPKCKISSSTRDTQFYVDDGGDVFNMGVAVWTVETIIAGNPSITKAGVINPTTGRMDWNPGFWGTVNIYAHPSNCAGTNDPRRGTYDPDLSQLYTVIIPEGPPEITDISIASSGTGSSLPKCPVQAGQITKFESNYSYEGLDNPIVWSINNTEAGDIDPISGVLTWEEGFFGELRVIAKSVKLEESCYVAEDSILVVIPKPPTISLSSGFNTNNAKLCKGIELSPIIYTVEGAVGGVAHSGLPNGLEGEYSVSNQITKFSINGTSSTAGETYNISIAERNYSYTTQAAGETGEFIAGKFFEKINNNPNVTVLQNANELKFEAREEGYIFQVSNSRLGNSPQLTFSPIETIEDYREFKITGTPIDNPGSYHYSINTISVEGGCATAIATGTIIIDSDSTIQLNHGSNDDQIVCNNAPITDIVYNIENANDAYVEVPPAGASFTEGLPNGVDFTFTGKQIIISGIPDVSITTTATFVFTVKTRDVVSGCQVATAVGRITVSPNLQVSLISRPYTQNQQVCVGESIENVLYQLSSPSDEESHNFSYDFSGLPQGVGGVYEQPERKITLSGIPEPNPPISETKVYHYTINATNCEGDIQSTKGTITVDPRPYIELISDSGSDAQVLCTNESLQDIKYQIQGGSGYELTIDPNINWISRGIDPAKNQIILRGTPNTKVLRKTVYEYTISPKYSDYGCTDSRSVKGKITLLPEQGMILTAGSGLMNQEICEEDSFQPLRFDFVGSATAASVTGLPPGLGGNIETMLQKTKVHIGTGNINNIGEEYTIRLNNTDFTYTTVAADIGLSNKLPDSLKNLIDGDSNYNCELVGNDLIISSTVSGVYFDTQIETEYNSVVLGPITTLNPASQYVIDGKLSFNETLPKSYVYTIKTTGVNCESYLVSGTINLNPKSTIVLDSPVITDNQVICDGAEIDDIVFQLANGASGATLLGQPPGINGNFDTEKGEFTISGRVDSDVTTRTVYNMVITTTANRYFCEEATALARIEVIPKESIQLISSSQTDAQSVCGSESGTKIKDIIYQLGGAAINYNISGLPLGVIAEYDSTMRQITITGTATEVTKTTEYRYLITTSGSMCGSASATGIIIVTPQPKLLLKSDPETADQTLLNAVCDGAHIDPIVYEIGEGATAAVVIGLPNGLETSLNGNIFTISGKTNISNTEPQTFEFTVETKGSPCSPPAQLKGSIEVNPFPSVDKDYITANDITHVSCFGGNDGAIDIPTESPDFDFRIIGKQNVMRQTDRLILQNDPNLLDEVTINIDGIDYQHTVLPIAVGGSAQNISQLTQSLVQEINEASGSNESSVMAEFESPSTILLSAKTPGISFAVTATVAPLSSPTKITHTNITQNYKSNYSFEWSGPEGFKSSSLNISNLIAGTYRLKVNINDCEGEEVIFEIKEPEKITIDFLSCKDTFRGTISGGESPYVVELLDRSGRVIGTKTVVKEVIYSDLISGQDYTLKIKGESCAQETIVPINIPYGLQFESDKVELVKDYCNQNPDVGDGYIKLGGGALGDAFSGGSNQFSYTWTGPNDQTFNTRDIYNLIPGTYSVIVKDKVLGCEETQSFVVEAVNPIVISADSSNKFDANGALNLTCYGDSNASISTFVNGGSGSYSFSWTRDNVVMPNLNTASISGLSAGVYELTVTDNPPIGLSPQPKPCQVSKKFVVNQPDEFSVIMSKTSSHTLCSGDHTSIAFDIFGGVPPFEFQLNGEAYTRTERKFIIENLNPLETGPTYVAIFNDANGCVPKKQPDPISFPSLTKVEFKAVTENIDCPNNKFGSISISTVNNTQIIEPTLTQIQWISATMNQYDTWENNKGKLENITQPGNYKVVITDKNGCELFTEEFKIIGLGEQLSLDKLDVTQIGCAGDSNKIELSLSGGNPPYQIIWQKFMAIETIVNNNSSTTTVSTSSTQTVTQHKWVNMNEHNNKALITDIEYGSYRAIVSDQSNVFDGNQCGGTITTKIIVIGEADIQLKNFKSNVSSECDPAEEEVSIQFNLFNNLYDEYNNPAKLTIKLNNEIMSSENGDIEGPGLNGLYVIKNIKPGNHSLNISNNVDTSCELIYPFEITERKPIVYSGPTEFNLEQCEQFTTINVSGSQVTGGVPFDLNGQSTYDFEWNYTDNNGETREYLGPEIIQAYPGTYELKILDKNNCKSENPIIITVNSNHNSSSPIEVRGILVNPANPNSSELLKVIPPQCSGEGSSGQIGIGVDGGIKPFTIKWYFESSKTGGSSQTSSVYEELKSYQNATVINNLKSGRYRLVIESIADPCSEEKNQFNYYSEDIIVPVNQDFFIENGPTPRYDNLCKGESGELLISVFDKNDGDLTFYYNESIINSEKIESNGVADLYVLSVNEPVSKAILKITNSNNCTIEKEINLLELGDPNFDYTSPSYEANGKTSVLAREEVTFKNTSEEPYLSSTWSFGDGTELLRSDRLIDVSTHVRHIYAISGTYFVTLRVMNALGCEKEITKKITVGKGYNILAPNVFTPNNDRINDRFRVVFSGFESLSLTIFDNYGNLIYTEKVSESDVNNPTGIHLQGWDGQGGSSETPYFIYTVQGVLLSDHETLIERSGIFSMLR
ncbi:MAG: PKD domain-containing protein [Flavobacteriaceae bacterium]